MLNMFTLCMSRGPPPLQDSCQRKNANNKKQIKGGYLLRYRRGFFCSGWCEEWVVLYEDSTLAWFTDKTLSRPKGSVKISDAPDFLAVGEYTRQVPRKPMFPRACHIGQLLAVGCRKIRDVHWLMGQSPAEMNDWMTAISNTLPPPPHLPLQDKSLSLTQHKGLANGHATPVSNGCATIIPNGRCSSAPPSVNKTNSCNSKNCNQSSNYKLEKNYRYQNNARKGKFDNDHTVVSGIIGGVCVDWGHGWGWANETAAVAPQITFTAETALSSAVYCHTDDYSMTGYDDVDWSAFGDFCF